MSEVLTRWNLLPPTTAVNEILPCCGAQAWASGVVARRPLPNEASLLAASDEIWASLSESDWMEAFRSHPRIGESISAGTRSQAATWSQQEQRTVANAADSVKSALAEGNRVYERKFGSTFIVYATGKSSEKILKILQRRLKNDERTELGEAVEQQRQITRLRLRKWLQE